MNDPTVSKVKPVRISNSLSGMFNVEKDRSLRSSFPKDRRTVVLKLAKDRPALVTRLVDNSDPEAIDHPFSPEPRENGDELTEVNEQLKSESETPIASGKKVNEQHQSRLQKQEQQQQQQSQQRKQSQQGQKQQQKKPSQQRKQPKQQRQQQQNAKMKQEIETTAILPPPVLDTKSPTLEGEKKEKSETDVDEGVVLQDTSTDIEDPPVVPPPSAKSGRQRILKSEQASAFIVPISHSFEAFCQSQKSLPPTGRSTPKRPLSRGTGDRSLSSSAGSSKTKTKAKPSTNLKRPLSRDRGQSQLTSSTGTDTKIKKDPSGPHKDMDLDSVLDFDTKRLGEPDGAESGVVMDMEGSLPVFSDSGDLTPEPTRITPRGKINKPKKPKPTPRGMAL